MHPYGTWPSPITAESLTAGTLALGTAAFDGADLYWLQASPTDGGRVSLWCRRDAAAGKPGDEPAVAPGQEREVTPAPSNVRTRVHEYGGGAFAVAGGTVVVSDFIDNRLQLISRAQPAPRALTADPALRYAALSIDPDQDLLIAVREDHRVADREPVNTVIARRLSDGPAVADRVLCAGADFYASPQLSPQGRLAWWEWVHPNMPWDSTQLLVADLPVDEQGRVDLEGLDGPLPSPQPIAGGPGESVAVPRWAPDGSLIFVSDRSDWWNLYRAVGFGPGADVEVRPLCPMAAEFAPPQWVLGDQPYVIIDDDRIACSWNAGNRHHLGVLTVSTGELAEIDLGAVEVGSLTGQGNQLVTRLGYTDRPAELTMIDITDGQTRVLRRSSDRRIDPGLVSTALDVQWDSDAGPVHGWFYPPRNAAYDGGHTAYEDGKAGYDGHQGGELPPMITVSHGGPTGGSTAAFDLDVQFWTSRGIAVLDVNYGGSTGYGRRYRERLLGSWGLVDVADCAAGARAMADQGRVDPARLAIQGRSAGGYTTLRALTWTDVFTAGISLYGIGDLTALAADTHKFESRYPDSLVGPYPAAAAVYADRSPINHVDQLNAPILLLQGTEDKVVPPNQAETFAAAARDKGLEVELIMYPGEGHGFRRSENIIDSLEASLSFLGRVFAFSPAATAE